MTDDPITYDLKYQEEQAAKLTAVLQMSVIETCQAYMMPKLVREPEFKGVNLKDTKETGNTGYVNTCFVAGTLIETEEGLKPIEEINTGDYVWSEEIISGKKGLKRVANTFVHDKKRLVYVYINGRRIDTTEEHPFWVERKGWILAGQLKKGDVLRLKSDDNVSVIDIEYIDLEEPVKVYNFEVEDWHTYFVSDINVLVHNKSNLANRKGWIQHDTYNQVRNKFGKDGVDKFIDAMNKGIVGGQGENGIKMLSGNGVKVGSTYYSYEIKVKGKLGDWRIFGNYDEVSEQIIFDTFAKGKH